MSGKSAGLGLQLLRHRHRPGVPEAVDALARWTAGRARLSPTGADTIGSAALREGLAHGAAGVAYFLLEYKSSTGDPVDLRRAEQACAELAGVGDFLVDVAVASGSSESAEEFWDAAHAVAAVILTRSGGAPARPVFPDQGLARAGVTWAGGSAGVLGFLRRLHDRGGPRLGLIG
ncbi:hypothetical protein AB0A71_32345 [Kitasatospora aureofaciens]|uniref:hypothetical protein n=1 Tax=Kitasatospora aureofaciens TaxID=1894 RepID=UPI003403F130